MGKSRAAEAEPETTEAAETKKYVVYKDAQHYDRREISTRDWESVGVTDAPTVVWDAQNRHRVPVEQFAFLTKDQFSQYILADARLEVVEL